jgi:acetate---CoA ligase (ADP-forming)
VQGGGLGAAIWAAADHGLGLSWLISTGNEASLEVSDFVAHLAGDDRTSVIALILENVKVGERFKKSVAKARDAGKTILAVRVGRTSAGERAAALHTGVIAGPDRMYDAVFAELGIQRCRDIEHMTTLATLLTRYDRPAADGVGIVTFSGGSGALTADCFAYQGIAIPEPGEETKASLTTLMASYANASNPLDTTTAVYGDPDAFSETLKLLADDERYGAIVVPVPFYYPILIDRLLLAVERAAQTRSKPIIPLWLGQGNEPPSLRALEQAGIVVLRNLSTAAVALGDFLDAPKARSVDSVMVSREVEEAVAHLRALASRQQGEFIAEYELKKVLAVAGMKAPAEDLATTADEAVLIAGEFDGPVALKVVSSQIAHKMRVGGVRLGVIGRDAVRAAFEDITTAVNRALDHPKIDGILVQEMVTGPELMIGLEVDPTWGTMVVLGLGGPYAEHIRGHAIRSAPLDMETALDMVGTAPIADVVDNSPCSREAVAALLVNISCLVDKASGLVSGVDLNPVVLTPGGVRVIDAVAHLRGHAHAPD